MSTISKSPVVYSEYDKGLRVETSSKVNGPDSPRIALHVYHPRLPFIFRKVVRLNVVSKHVVKSFTLSSPLPTLFYILVSPFFKRKYNTPENVNDNNGSLTRVKKPSQYIMTLQWLDVKLVVIHYDNSNPRSYLKIVLIILSSVPRKD